jgi:signal transduction histidine kinase
MHWSIKNKIVGGFALGSAILLTSGLVGYTRTLSLIQDSRWTSHTQEVLKELQKTLTTVTDAETGQRGYIITGEETYLEPYNKAIFAIDERIQRLRKLTADNVNQQRRINVLQLKISDRFELLKYTIELRKTKGYKAAWEFVLTGSGKQTMDEIRNLIDQMETEENALLAGRSEKEKTSAHNTILSYLIGIFLNFCLLCFVYYQMHREISKRQQAEKQIIDLNQELMRQSVELAAANKELEAFNYSVSHDLRAPLRHINGFTMLLQQFYADSLDEEGKEYLQRMALAGQRMGKMIDDFLNLSRISRAPIQPQSVDLSSLAESIALQLQSTQADRNVTFNIAKGAIAKGDEGLLRLMLENLLGNAWKYTSSKVNAIIEFGIVDSNRRQGAGDAELEERNNAFTASSQSPTPNPQLPTPIYFVRDNGVGFDIKHAEKIFKPFQRLHSITEFEGTGVGLATVGRIIERHSGRIWVEASVEQGATFYFTLGL